MPIVLRHRYKIAIKLATRSINPVYFNSLCGWPAHPLKNSSKVCLSRMSPGPSLPALSSRNDVQGLFTGKDIGGLPKPAAILDTDKAARHCKDMLDAIKWLGVDFRAYVKTHNVS